MDRSTQSDLVAEGIVHPDDPVGEPVPARLVVTADVLRAGRGPLVIDLAIGDRTLLSASLVWVVRTDTGWAHLRGLAEPDGADPARPFRADLFSAAAIDDPGPDRIAVRLYGPTDDPDVDGPTHKLHGWLASGSVRLGRRR